MSKPESGESEPEFKPVVRTMRHVDKELWQLMYLELPPSIAPEKLTKDKLIRLTIKGALTSIEATPNHPFWVEDVGWTRFDSLEYGQIIHSEMDNLKYMVLQVTPVLRTNILNIVATYSIYNMFEADRKGQEIDDGDYYDFSKRDENGILIGVLNGGVGSLSPLVDKDYKLVEISEDIYTTTVYNFEVADFHTYYVWDLWVHNKNSIGRMG